MVARDAIAEAIAQPIDWRRFEELAYAVLVADDLPNLRKVGGVGDDGVDSLEEAFYEGVRGTQVIVQVTSDQAQRTKVKNTIKKLRENGFPVTELVIVSRHPVEAGILRDIQAASTDANVRIDVRGDQYLIAQLSKPGSPIYARFFGSSREQLEVLLSQPDALHTTTSRAHHALLASLGAFVLSDRARLARGTLFDKSILAIIAEKGGRATPEQIAGTGELLPGDAVDLQQIHASIVRLCNEGHCVMEGTAVVCTDAIMSRFVEVGQAAKLGYRRLLDHVIVGCKKATPLSDAQLGYLERNIRRALLQLFRISGPVNADHDDAIVASSNSFEDIAPTIGKDLPVEVGRTALAAFSSFTSDVSAAKLLAPLVRSYSALAIRNIDPAGRRWQQATLARSCIALDTDAILYLLVEDLPEHNALLNALRGLQNQGVEIQVSDHVLTEAIGHIGRAHRTFRRFSAELLRLPPAIVNARVWHAIVRGYYYAHSRGYSGSPESYTEKYQDPTQPYQYLEHLLSKRLPMRRVSLGQVDQRLEVVLNELESVVLQYRERNRKKAVFRDPGEMTARVRADVSMALNLAERENPAVGAHAVGYLASSDLGFKLMQNQSVWKPRHDVLLATMSVPELASFICATTLSDDEAVNLLFHPVSIAVADALGAEISVLAGIGIDLKDEPLDRLDWDLQRKLRGCLGALEHAASDESAQDNQATARAALETAKQAQQIGYRVAGPVAMIIQSFESLRAANETERQARLEAERKLKSFFEEARQTTKKGRTRINRIARSLGIDFGGEHPGSDDNLDGDGHDEQ